jgi:phage terminase small subunit
MGDRGPKSYKQNLTVLKPVKRRRPNPLPGMSTMARSVWLRVVNVYEPGHFKPQHYDLLRMYCEFSARNKRAEAAIAKSGDLIKQSNGVVKPNPYNAIALTTAAQATAIATKLGITYNATTVSKGDTGQNSKPKSKREGLIFKG